MSSLSLLPGLWLCRKESDEGKQKLLHFKSLRLPTGALASITLMRLRLRAGQGRPAQASAGPCPHAV